MDRVDVTVIGAGIIGLAVAAELGRRYPKLSILLLERHGRFGLEASSRNSEVIDSGIYSTPGSLKALHCVQGNTWLYDFCSKWQIPHRRMGKLIVAGNRVEAEGLQVLYWQGLQNGIEGLEFISRKGLAKLDPYITGIEALFVPSTGIVDTNQVMNRLEQLAKDTGILMAYSHEVIAASPVQDGFEIHCRCPDNTTDHFRSFWLINCAGMDADRVAEFLGIEIDSAGYRHFLCKGEYFSIPTQQGKLINHIVHAGGLHGLHLTKSLDGRVRLGPNILFVDKADYSVDETHAIDFFEQGKIFLPFLAIKDLQPDMAGVRAKLHKPGEPMRDFIVQHEGSRGLPGAINLLGIELPGFTASLSLGRMVADILADG